MTGDSKTKSMPKKRQNCNIAKAAWKHTKANMCKAAVLKHPETANSHNVLIPQTVTQKESLNGKFMFDMQYNVTKLKNCRAMCHD